MEDNLSLPHSLLIHLSQRKEMFYPKADINVTDEYLRTLAKRQLVEDGINQSLVIKALKHAGIVASHCYASPLQGTFHAIFLSESFPNSPLILRINRLSSVFVNLQLYADLIVALALEKGGIDHVDIRFVDCSRQVVPFDYQILGLVGGRPLSELDHDDTLMIPAIRKVAKHLKQIHQIKGIGFGFLDVSEMVLHNKPSLVGVHSSWKDYILLKLKHHLDFCKEAGLITIPEYSEINNYFMSASWLDSVEPRLLHGDSGNHNIFIQDKKVVLIDWEDCLIGDPIFEIAYWATFHPERRWGVFFSSYFDHEWKPSFQFWLYYLRVALSKSVHRLRFGYDDRSDRPRASLRIQRGIAGLREWG